MSHLFDNSTHMVQVGTLQAHIWLMHFCLCRLFKLAYLNYLACHTCLTSPYACGSSRHAMMLSCISCISCIQDLYIGSLSWYSHASPIFNALNANSSHPCDLMHLLYLNPSMWEITVGMLQRLYAPHMSNTTYVMVHVDKLGHHRCLMHLTPSTQVI